jgi:hypothetical protein
VLIGISVTSVTSKRSCALDDSPSVKESETNGEQARENRFETLDSVDSAIFDKSLNNVFLLVASCSCSKVNTGVRV